MTSLKEFAKGYEPKQLKNIADLEIVPIEQLEVKEELEAEFPYKYVEIEGERHRVTNSVIEQLKEIIKEKPNLKAIKVSKKGEGLKTSYTVIPLD